MKKRRLLFLLLSAYLAQGPTYSQNALNNVHITPGSSDNVGRSSAQVGSEVLHSTIGVTFEPTGSFEHVGQFYVAGDGIWNQSGEQSTDYFGYAPGGLGSNMPYLGKGIMGASAANGAQGAGRPAFGHIQLNSTGVFPVVGGMYVAHSLAFNVSGPGKSSVITTPNTTSPASSQNAVVFAPGAIISGADASSYIDGFASVSDVAGPFTLPLGDSGDEATPLHPLTINNAIQGTVTARYLHTVQHSITALGFGIGSVSPVGTWPISAPAGTNITVSTPTLDASEKEAVNLRLVGWNGRQWVSLSNEATAGACVSGGCPLRGTILEGITALAIGSTTQALSGKESGDLTKLTLWPNPTSGQLNLRLPAGKDIREVNVLDLQGRSVLRPRQTTSTVNASALPTGSYILEVQTTQGQTFRKQFVKQP